MVVSRGPQGAPRRWALDVGGAPGVSVLVDPGLLLCNSFGGTFGQADLIGHSSITTVVWTCDGYHTDGTVSQFKTRFHQLGFDCFADGGNTDAATGGTTANFTCGKK